MPAVILGVAWVARMDASPPVMSITQAVAVACAIWIIYALRGLARATIITRVGDAIAIEWTLSPRSTRLLPIADCRMTVRETARRYKSTSPSARSGWYFSVVVDLAGREVPITPAYGNYLAANEVRQRIVQRLGLPTSVVQA